MLASQTSLYAPMMELLLTPLLRSEETDKAAADALDPTKNGVADALDPTKNGVADALDPS